MLPLEYMHLAFDEALQAIGTSRPNPAVGAILVRDGEIVGRGRTQKPGSHHAEIMALLDAGEKAEGADMYVTLEPCCHWGRTPPCTDAILKAKVSRMYIAVVDQNPKVNGGGIAKLREGGVQVDVGLEAEYGEDFYCGFFHHLRTGLPWVDVKIAQTLDGFIAGEHRERTQISGAEASQWVHRLRARVDAIIVGGGTALHDDPRLNVRGVPGHSPQRIVVCGSTPLSPQLKMFQDGGAPCLVYSRGPQNLLPATVQSWPSPDFAESWIALLQQLGEAGYHRVLLEAGATMAQLVLCDVRLWNRFLLMTAPRFLGKGLPWSAALGQTWIDSLHLSRFELVGTDYLAEFENVHGNHSGPRSNP